MSVPRPGRAEEVSENAHRASDAPKVPLVPEVPKDGKVSSNHHPVIRVMRVPYQKESTDQRRTYGRSTDLVGDSLKTRMNNCPLTPISGGRIYLETEPSPKITLVTLFQVRVRTVPS